MNLNLHGKMISAINWPPIENADMHRLNATDICPLQLSATNHGDRHEFWVIQLQGNDRGEVVEIARYNAKYLESIEWLVAE